VAAKWETNRSVSYEATSVVNDLSPATVQMSIRAVFPLEKGRVFASTSTQTIAVLTNLHQITHPKDSIPPSQESACPKSNQSSPQNYQTHLIQRIVKDENEV
jgi:hypothetical protein